MQVDAQLLPAPVVVVTKLKPAEMLAPLSQASEPSELPPPLPNVSGLVCPLCHEMLEDPVMAVDGHTYCRRCIQDWFQQTEAGSKPKSPVTGQPLLSLLLFPNLALGKALISIRTNMQPAWLQAEKERQALRAELDLKTRELIQAKAQSSGKDYSKDLTEAELNVAQLTAKLQIADEETRAGRGEVERLNKELGGLREKLERTQAQISGERSAMQQIDELDSLLRFSKAEVTRLQTELESVKKQETELRRGKYRYEIDMAKVTQENQKNQEELVRLRFQTQSQEGIPSSVVLAETLDTAKKDLEAKDTVIRELQLAGTRAGAQLVDLMEKQRQSEILLRRVPELEAENHALRQELNGKVAELSALKETLLQTEEKLRLREAAPELTAAELLASEAERLEEELAFAHDQLANWQVEFKKREDLLRGIPLVFADFLAQINAPDPALSSSNLRPEDAPRFVIAALQRLQLTMVKREEELKFAHEKIAELSQYAGSQGMSGSFIAKMAMLMYLLEVSVLSGSGLRDAKWKPSSNGAGLSCTVEIPGKEDKLVTKSIHTTKDPVWNHTGDLQMSHSDSLCFTVQGEHKIGQAVLPASRAVVAGFEGDLKLNATETGLENAMIKVKIVVKMSFMAGENPRTGGSNGPAAKPSDPPKHPGKAQPSSTSNSGTDSDSSSSGSSAGGPKALLNAAKAGDLAQVSSLVKGAQAKDLTAALHAACSEGHRKLVAPLCKGKADVRGGSNQMNLRPMPLLPYQRAVEVQVLPEITSPESFKVDVSVPEICLPNPKVLLRRSTLPALDIRSEALMLSRQLHLDFHEVKFVLQELRSESEHLPNGGLEYGAFQQCLQRICGVELEEQWVVNAYKECRASEGPVDSEQLLIWYRDHIFNLEAFKLQKHFAAEKSGAALVTLDLAKKFHCSCLDLDKMKVKFDDFDLDKSGFIDHYEFEKMMYQLLHCSSESDFPKTRLDRFWNEADKNGDGQIDFEEFLEWYMKYFGTSYENGPMDAFYASFMPGVQRSSSFGELKGHKVQEKISLKPIVPEVSSRCSALTFSKF